MRSRHDRYLAWSHAIEHALGLPRSLRTSRFCLAAALITGPSGLGLLHRWPRGIAALVRLGLLDDSALAHLESVSATLLACNVGRLQRVASQRHDVADDARAFDDAMVVFDQQAVERYLRRHELPATTRRGIDRLLAAGASRTLGVVLGIDPALRAALRAQREADGGRLTFFSLATRVAIGQRLLRAMQAAAKT